MFFAQLFSYQRYIIRYVDMHTIIQSFRKKNGAVLTVYKTVTQHDQTLRVVALYPVAQTVLCKIIQLCM